LIDEADTLIVAAPRVQRTLQRRLFALKELAQHYRTDAEGQERLRHLIDRLQVAILAVDEAGRCIAASDGATVLTGYSRPQLLTASVLHDGFAAGHVSDELWRSILANRPYAGTMTITTRDGEDVPVHAAAVAKILPGLHVAAFVAA
jgi:PAS domain S-box-containing protein